MVNKDEGQTEYICHVRFPVPVSRWAMFSLDLLKKINACTEFLTAQGIMLEPEPSLALPDKGERQVASEPTSLVSSGATTPRTSPTASPKKKKAKLGPSVCFCFCWTPKIFGDL
jgi:hypothetical protein